MDSKGGDRPAVNPGRGLRGSTAEHLLMITDATKYRNVVCGCDVFWRRLTIPLAEFTRASGMKHQRYKYRGMYVAKQTL